ncbi:unnamed protein product [Heligmosomoides polygyrus]|uniref:Uncharacterized protein n=1 Tax=Heligmosomoides polygyrus TaxID=6339 RepID=A0A183FVF7_HELPZ|nr:unnamed protein product [Heligmosomoides polygyrus]
MVHEAVVFLVNVDHNNIFLKTGERGVEVPVGDRSGTPLLTLPSLLDAKSKTSCERGGGPIRVELGNSGDVGQAILTPPRIPRSIEGREASGTNQLHVEGFDLFVVVVGCWGICAVKAGTGTHRSSRKRPILVIKDSYESMFMAKCVLTRTTNASYSLLSHVPRNSSSPDSRGYVLSQYHGWVLTDLEDIANVTCGQAAPVV